MLTLNVWATQGLFPDLVILLHLEPERGLLRSTEAPDRMELEGQDFHAKVADAYLKIAEEHPERFVMIDADQVTGGGLRRRPSRARQGARGVRAHERRGRLTEVASSVQNVRST